MALGPARPGAERAGRQEAFPTALDSPLRESRARLSHAAIDLVERLLKLRPPARVDRGRQLPLELGARQPQRLERADLFGVANLAHRRLGPLPLEFFHAFLDSGVCVDQPFTCVAHSVNPLSTYGGQTGPAPHYKMAR